MWDLPRPGLEPVSPALAGRFSTTEPWGKPKEVFFTGKGLEILIYRYLQTVLTEHLFFAKLCNTLGIYKETRPDLEANEQIHAI